MTITKAMNKILDVLLFLLIELVGRLVMRDLRRWARGYYIGIVPI